MSYSNYRRTERLFYYKFSFYTFTLHKHVIKACTDLRKIQLLGWPKNVPTTTVNSQFMLNFKMK